MSSHQAMGSQLIGTLVSSMVSPSSCPLSHSADIYA